MADVLVAGCGLIGASIGLALQGSKELGDVVLMDRDPEALGQAVRRGAGRAWDGEEHARLAVIAVPPAVAGATLLGLQELGIASTFTHVASVQSGVQAEVEALSSDPSVIVGGHPLAGREISGPQAAMADLFIGRPWAVCPGPGSSTAAVDLVKALARECGATPMEVPADVHDRAVAVSSHVPQLVASLLAGLLLDTGAGTAADLSLAGPGLADMTRLAAGDPGLWVQILTANAGKVAPPLQSLAERLRSAGEALQVLADGTVDHTEAELRVRTLLEEGNAGRRLVPLKRGEVSAAFVPLRVWVPDEPGQLAALLTCAGHAGVNVEDVRVEHVPGRQHGVIELMVAPDSEGALREALEKEAWRVT